MLCELLERQYFSGMGKYWAKEVSIDPWAAKGKPKRVDYMQFIPANQCSVSAIEKGIFVCYEIKSCKEDFYSGNGLNFLGEKNYIVTTMQCYKELLEDMRNGKFWKHIHENFPESATHVGVMVAVPEYTTAADEFESPTPINTDKKWKLAVVMPCHQSYIGLRNRYDSMKAAIDILRDQNTGVLQVIREIEKLYEATNEKQGFYAEYSEEWKEFDRYTDALPQEAWIA